MEFTTGAFCDDANFVLIGEEGVINDFSAEQDGSLVINFRLKSEDLESGFLRGSRACGVKMIFAKNELIKAS